MSLVETQGRRFVRFVPGGEGGPCSEHLSCSWMIQSGRVSSGAQFVTVGSGSGAEAAEQLHCLSPEFTFISVLAFQSKENTRSCFLAQELSGSYFNRALGCEVFRKAFQGQS